MILLVTVTKDRPKPFAQLVTNVENQSVGECDWLVVTDGWDGYKFPKTCKLLKRPNDNDTLPSICENWLAALKFIEDHEQYDRIIVLEDDDWYHVNYVKETRKNLESAELVGWHEDAYYYVMSRKAKRVHNVGFASLAATGFHRSVLPFLRECASQGNVFIDKMLWTGISQTSLVAQPPLVFKDGSRRELAPVPITQIVKRWEGTRQLYDNFTGLPWPTREQPKMNKDGNIIGEHPRHVGLKQNWHGGAGGLSTGGHDASMGGGFDMYGKKLREWIGEEANFYLQLTQHALPAAPPEKNHYAAGIIHSLEIEADSFWNRQ